MMYLGNDFSAHVSAYRDEQPVTFAKAKTVHRLIDLAADSARKEGYEAGQRDVTSLDLGYSHDSRASVHIITAKSRRALSAEIKRRNHREDTGCGADCTGRAFAWSCELLRAYREGSNWYGVCVSRVHFDV